MVLIDPAGISPQGIEDILLFFEKNQEFEFTTVLFIPWRDILDLYVVPELVNYELKELTQQKRKRGTFVIKHDK